MHLGDIEDLYSRYSGAFEYSCVVCPWHKWTFDLSSGKQVRPHGKHLCVNVYPVRTTNSGQILIGFSSIDQACFTSSSDF